MQLPDLSKTTLSTIKKLFSGGAHITKFAAKKVSPHVTEFAGIVVNKATKKAYYVADLRVLINHGVSVKDAASSLGMSTSYAYKLLKKK